MTTAIKLDEYAAMDDELERHEHERSSYAWIVMHRAVEEHIDVAAFPIYGNALEFAAREDVDFIALLHTWTDWETLETKSRVEKFDPESYRYQKMEAEQDEINRLGDIAEAERAADLADYYRRLL